MKKIAIYPGTFDPITKGHVDIASRAAILFDAVIVAVAISDRKKPYFSDEKRIAFCREALKDFKNIKVLPLEILAVEFAKQHAAQYIVRGIRSSDDVNYELSIAGMNNALSDHQIETVFLAASEQYRFISSTIVREIIALGGDVSAFVPFAVATDSEAKRERKIRLTQ